MAEFWDSWDDDWTDYYSPKDTPDVNELLYGNDSVSDAHARELFEAAFFDNDQGAYMNLLDYMWEEYNIDFEDAFAWEDFREWYDQNK